MIRRRLPALLLAALLLEPAAARAQLLSALPQAGVTTRADTLVCNQGVNSPVTRRCSVPSLFAAMTPADIRAALNGRSPVLSINGGAPNAAGDVTVTTTDASQLTQGVLPDARLSPTAAATSLGYVPMQRDLSNALPVAGPLSFAGSALRVGSGVAAGLAGDNTNVALRAPNASGGSVFLQNYGGATTWAMVSDAGAVFQVPVTGPTPAAGDSSTRLATTAFVQAGLAGKQPSLGYVPVQQGGGQGQGADPVKIGWDGARLAYDVDAGAVSGQFANIGDVAGRVARTGDTMTGALSGPTPASGDSSTRYATTAFVASAISAAGTGGGSPPTTDASKLTQGTLPDARLSSTAAAASLGYVPLQRDFSNALASSTALSFAGTALQVGPGALSGLTADNTSLALRTPNAAAGALLVQSYNGAATWASFSSTGATFAGAVTGSTPGLGDNSTRFATTAFVVAHTRCPQITDFGADSTGANSSDAAFDAALAATANSDQRCIYLPVGNYALNSKHTINLLGRTASLTVVADGIETARIVCGAACLQINESSPEQSFHLRGFSMLTTAAGGGGAAISVTNSTNTTNPALSVNSDVTDVMFRGSDGPGGSNWWTTGFVSQGASNINFTNVGMTGPGVAPTERGVMFRLMGNSSSSYSVAFNFQGVFGDAIDQGISLGDWVQGVSVNQTNFTECNTGVLNAGAGGDQLVVSNSQLACASVGVYDQVGLINLQLVNNTCGTPFLNATCFYLDHTRYFSIVGNSISASNTSNTTGGGVIVADNAAYGVISANLVFQNNVGVTIGPNVTNVKLSTNSYQGNKTDYIAPTGNNNSIGTATP